jgi:beta-hydroxyacyl-ACP dehydratase FabZ
LSEPASDFQLEWILSVLPHRYPFLLVDRVLEMEPGKRIRAIKNVTANEGYFQGHFPSRPVMPGVLLIEGIAQTAGILLIHDRPNRDSQLVYLTGVERARFRRPVVPGDQVVFEVEILKLRRNFSRIGGKALVDGKVAAEAIVSSVMVDR